MHARHPEAFHIPSLEERSSLRVGARVKLLFLLMTSERGQPMVQVERMWCTIREVAGGRYIGTLDSIAATSGALQPGDRIEFGPEHVASVLIPHTDPRHPDFGKLSD